MLKRVPIGSVLPNPFDKGLVDDDHVQDLVASYKDKFEDILPARSREDGFFELAIGKHRLQAAKLIVGPKGFLNLNVEPRSDQEMVRFSLVENLIRRRVPDDEFKAAIAWARDFLIAHPDACKRAKGQNVTSHSGGLKGCQEGFHGNSKCVLAFMEFPDRLRPKVSRFLAQLRISDESLSVPEPIPPQQNGEPTDVTGMLALGDTANQKEKEPVDSATLSAEIKDLRAGLETQVGATGGSSGQDKVRGAVPVALPDLPPGN